jgi:predicted PurR-regulated permease PerM
MKITEKRWFRFGIGLILILTIFWLLNEVSFIFTPLVIFVQTLFLPFLIAGILFYLFRPLTHVLEQWHVPRKVAILLIFLVIIGLVATVVALLGPIVQKQFVQLIDNIPAMISTVQEGISFWQENQQFIPEFVKEAVYNIGNKLESIFATTGSFIGNLLSSVFGFVFALVIVPFILFYLLHDREKFASNVSRFFPDSKEGEIRDVLRDMDKAIASYIQGQLIVSTCVGILLLIGYLIIGLDYSLLLALFAMITNVIPFLGPFIAVIPAVIVAFFQDPVMVLWVAIIMLLAQQIESNLVSPQVMGRALNVHPLTIILLILVGGNLAGVLGMILIIPTYAVAKVVVQHSYQLLSIKRRED